MTHPRLDRILRLVCILLLRFCGVALLLSAGGGIARARAALPLVDDPRSHAIEALLTAAIGIAVGLLFIHNSYRLFKPLPK